ncbi:VWA domain-containing protein [Burkholderia cenocepacia]|uniref:VWA domain-containing protein n=1 Tax=Burkholderia cenocepacia TaxID=95486 RepID=UPI00076205E3|nr:VWA domain-containing protein [Burkholderia cenocepacia]KWU17924.1 hypothetical protein AS149_14715 [Burkholderia cenocepacia]
MILLEKNIERVSLALSKYGVSEPPIVRVGAAFDVSGSAKHFYENGVMQATHDRVMALAGKFDDNGELDTWVFSDRFRQLVTADVNTYGTYVVEHILKSSVAKEVLWGGTSYAPVMGGAVDFWFGNPAPEVLEAAAPGSKKQPGLLTRLFGSKPAPVAVAPAPAVAAPAVDDPSRKLPAWMLFLTDGENGDQAATERQLAASQEHPVYWTLIGVGAAKHFEFIERMADKYPNVGFLNLSSLDIGEDELYEQLITQEVCDWLNDMSQPA